VSFLVAWRDDDPSTPLRQTTDPAEISAAFAALGCGFDRRPALALSPDADQDAVLSTHRDVIDEINAAEGFAAVDAINMYPTDDPDWLAGAQAVRSKFIDEHTHADHEVRLMARGATAFYVHSRDTVYAVHATAGDLIRVARGTTHWVDSGPVPDFAVIRFFHDPQGWTGTPTGSAISRRFPDFTAVHALALRQDH
jgi:1,2-dihydroxy-3-keto-5-methylthiopentene dioxygenase